VKENLYDKIALLTEFMGRPEIPDYILKGLRQSLPLRPYQVEALGNFLFYFENEKLRKKPSQTLFHMATGSGKTLIMASLILYLYKQGYRDFLFFVNNTNVLGKTRENFLNPASPKYLFNDTINIDGRTVSIRAVSNFQMSDPDGINICFTTVQGLHMDLNTPREGRMTYADFEERKVVLISDEAHHINALTRKGLTKAQKENEEELEKSWEYTVNRVFETHTDNVLVEFTATADLNNEAVAGKYADNIVADYPLRRYREDGYSKEIKLFQSDLEHLDRALQAVILSQYRLKVFERHNLDIRPRIMFKSRLIKDSGDFYQSFKEMMLSLDARKLEKLEKTTTAEVLKKAFKFFSEEGISLDSLAMEIREDFSDDHCLQINQQKISEDIQIAVNTLEHHLNPYRAVFAVDMLNEGWDVLNLFDIVRLYDTRDSKASKPGRTTIQEAQLIGRGARYCPFVLPDNDDRFRRKFDEDLEHPLRVCEELYYHSATNNAYIEELRTALRETGALPDKSVEVHYRLKDDFKKSDLYLQGWIFVNERRQQDRGTIKQLPSSIRDQHYTHRSSTGTTRTGIAFSNGDKETSVKTHATTKKISEITPSVVGKALRGNERLRFDRLKEKFPNLLSTRDFITNADYLGDVKITLESPNQNPTNEEWLDATVKAFEQVGVAIKDIEIEHHGTREFVARRLHSVITDKKCYISNPRGEGAGIAQSIVGEALKLNLSQLDWYGYEENYGTTEEKRFLRYFNTRIDELKKTYDLVIVLRNEGQVAIYDFETGRAFQPDFLLFLHKKSGRKKGYEQLQVFVEPKGEHLTEHDKWKEDLLISLEKEAIPTVKFSDDNDYLVWGLPFYTHEPAEEKRIFTDALDRVVERS